MRLELFLVEYSSKQGINLKNDIEMHLIYCVLAASTMVGFSAGLGETGDVTNEISVLQFAFVADRLGI